MKKLNNIVILYHKDIKILYKPEWIKQCIDSIKNQSLNDFIVYEMDYGGSDYSISKEYGLDNFIFFSKKLKNHAEAMNFLFDQISKEDFNCVFNINLDDWYLSNRFEIQYEKIEEGFDIVSSNFIIFDSDGTTKKMKFDDKNIIEEFNIDHNIIAHPSVCFSKNFILNNRYVTSEIPIEDFNLWKRTINKYKFIIVPEYLLNYRKHSNQITQKNLKQRTKEIINTNDNSLLNNYFNQKCICGQIKDRLNYNYCQKCNRIY